MLFGSNKGNIFIKKWLKIGSDFLFIIFMGI